MKRTTFMIIIRLHGIDLLKEVIAEEYDEYVYYVSPRMDINFRGSYSFYDKKTGLMVCTGKSKKELINKYNEVKERCTQVRESAHYKKYIERYEQLKKDLKEVNVWVTN